MRGALGWLVLVAGCDRVFGLDGRDPPRGDAPASDATDAPAAQCPASGVPAFAPPVESLGAQCYGYTTSRDRGVAMATCMGTIVEGPIDTILGPTLAQFAPPPDTEVLDPRLAPEGDELIVVHQAKVTTERSLAIYRRDGAWVFERLGTGLPSGVIGSDVLAASPPTRAGATGRRLFVTHGALTSVDLTEYIETGTDWEVVRTYQPVELGVKTFGAPSLSDDGLRLVFFGNRSDGPTEIFYAQRASLADTFTSAEAIELPFDNPMYPHLASDCGRLYFNALASLYAIGPA